MCWGHSGVAGELRDSVVIMLLLQAWMVKEQTSYSMLNEEISVYYIYIYAEDKCVDLELSNRYFIAGVSVYLGFHTSRKVEVFGQHGYDAGDLLLATKSR